mgnify:CR=1 FL=1
MKQECPHKSFQGENNYWICQWCKKSFSAEEIEKIMLAKRQGFAVDNEVGDTADR